MTSPIASSYTGARHLGKGYGLVCQQGQRDRQDIYALIQANQADRPIQAMCKHLQVSTSGYYKWRSHPTSQRSINDRIMTERIRKIHVMSDCTYGRARVQAELRDMGDCVNHKGIERLMKLANLQGVSRRRGYVVTTQRDRYAKAVPDLVKRQFTATGINQLWVADMTYAPTRAGFLYLAVVLDVYSLKVYNPFRLHRWLVQRSPNAFERSLNSQKTDADIIEAFDNC